LGEGFPGNAAQTNLLSIEKAKRIEQAIKSDICNLIPSYRPDVRLLPYIQLHEYEGLLFSDPSAFAFAIQRPELAAQFQRIRADFETPEDINDRSETAPSKRVLKVFPSYRKVLDGTVAARAVGINAMRESCPHFREWIERLQTLKAYSQSG
jgi:hypothetical protein